MTSGGTKTEKAKIDWERPIKTNDLAKAIWRGLSFTASMIEKVMRGEKV